MGTREEGIDMVLVLAEAPSKERRGLRWTDRTEGVIVEPLLGGVDEGRGESGVFGWEIEELCSRRSEEAAGMGAISGSASVVFALAGGQSSSIYPSFVAFDPVDPVSVIGSKGATIPSAEVSGSSGEYLAEAGSETSSA